MLVYLVAGEGPQEGTRHGYSTKYLYGGHYTPYIHPVNYAHVVGKRSAEAEPVPGKDPCKIIQINAFFPFKLEINF